jgi:hypothetical protein
MKWLGWVGWMAVCMAALAAPLTAQGQSSKKAQDTGYLLPKPELQADVMQKLLRLFEGGESARVEPWYPDGPDVLQYRYFGQDFFGHYWEERLADRGPKEVLPFWVSHFLENCKGRFTATSDPSLARGRSMVQSSAWTCAATNRAPYEGYITLHRTGPTVGVFVTMQPAREKSTARNIDRQIRAVLIERMKNGR